MGNVLPPTKELYILGCLSDQPGGLYGLEMVKASNGKLARGTVYVLLSRLEEKGFVTAKADPHANHPGLPRRQYKLTGLGRRALEAAELMGFSMVKA